MNRDGRPQHLPLPVPAETSAPRAPPSVAVPVLRSEDLFRGAPEVRLVHAHVEYRLRITRQGKLILTK